MNRDISTRQITKVAFIGSVIAWIVYKKGFIKHEDTGNF